MKFIGLFLISTGLMAQTPVGIGGTPNATYGVLGNGIVNYINWYVDISSAIQGDTYFWTAWAPNATGLPVPGGLPIIGTANDASIGCGANLMVLQLSAINMSAKTGSISVVNCMSSYGTQGATNNPSGWFGKYSSSINSTDGTWKSRVPFSKGGLIYLPVERQVSAGTNTIHDATMMVSPDNGLHWCNPYTLYNVGTSAGTCNSSKWQSDGDAPKCVASGGTSAGACTDSGYTDSTHSSMMWKLLPLGSENWEFINWGNQDGSSFPTGAGVADGCDPNTYTCFFLNGEGTLARVVNASIMDISAWQYSACASPHCDLTNNANWTSTFANRVPVLYNTYSTSSFNGSTELINAYGITYLKEFGSYVMTGQALDAMWAPSLQGPWTKFFQKYGGLLNGDFFVLAPALGYTVVSSNPPHIQVVGATNCNPSTCTPAGAPQMMTFDLYSGKTAKGETFQEEQLDAYGQTGSGFQFGIPNAAGTFPRKGLVWSWDMQEVTGCCGVPYFKDRSTYSAALVPCVIGYTSSITPTACGAVSSGAGTNINAFGAKTTNPGGSPAQWRVFPQPYSQSIGYPTTSSSAPSSMLGNGSYTVINVVRYDGSSGAAAGMWSAGSGNPVGMNQNAGAVTLDFGAIGSSRYQFVSSFTFPNTTDFQFVATTVSAAVSGCPTAKVWVQESGAIVDKLSGVTCSIANGGSPSSTPSIGAGPFVMGMSSTGVPSVMTYATMMVYDRPLTYPEIQMVYRALRAKLAARSITLPALGPIITSQSTNTQITLRYPIPAGAGACTVQVSEDPTFATVAHDVDGALYTNADQDTSRSTTTNDGTYRYFVAGARQTALALNSNYYSRALQTSTTYYAKVTCGASVLSATTATANIPLNMTYQDIPQLDPSTPGAVITPTIFNDATKTYIDPHTGTLLRQASFPADIPYDPMNPGTTGAYSYTGGFVKICSTTLTGPGPGYLCSYAQGGGGYGILTYIIPSTGESRYLGRMPFGFPYINAIDGKFYYLHNATDIKVYAYTGAYSSPSPGTPATLTSSDVLLNFPAAITAFNSLFTAADFGCGNATDDVGVVSTGDYLTLTCRRGTQDTYGWIGVAKISTGTIVAAMRMDSNLQCRWCAIHETYQMYDEPGLGLEIHGFVGTSPALGGGPYNSTYTGGSIGAGTTSITVSGDPSCPACGTDPEVAPPRVGDVFTWRDNTELSTITGISGTTWTITATTLSHTNGATLYMTCSFKPVFWKFLSDPLGTDATDTYVITDVYWPEGGHDDVVTGQRVGDNNASWAVNSGNVLTTINTPLTANPDFQPRFAGALAQCYGNGCPSHPSAGAPGSSYMNDFFKYGTEGADAAHFVPVTGQIYKYIHDPSYSHWNIRYFAIAGVTQATWSGGGPFSIRDISGVSSTLPSNSSGNYQRCMALAANECVSGSSVGDEFFNIPDAGWPQVPGSGTYASMIASSPAGGAIWKVTDAITDGSCSAGGGSGKSVCIFSGGTWNTYVCGFGDNSPCMNNFNPFANGALQIGLDGVSTRVITGGLTGLRDTNDYPTLKCLADGSYCVLPKGDVQYHIPAIQMMAKMPPFTPPSDSVDRTKFIDLQVPVTATGGSVRAWVKFGYLENGAPTDFYCISRAEACVANTNTAPPTDGTTDPFKFITTDAPSGLSCAATCTIHVPVLPAHHVYYMIQYLDISNAVLSSGPLTVGADYIGH